MSFSPMKTIKLFYSYSHKNEELRKQLETHLMSLKRQKIIDDWHDRKIGLGSEWKDELDENLKAADIILLLISPDFIASNYCYETELSYAMQQHEEGAAVVIPIILDFCDAQGLPFMKLQGAPKDMKPVTSWANQNEAFADIAKKIRTVTEQIREVRAALSSETLIRDVHRQAERWGNDYATSRSIEALAEVQQSLLANEYRNLCLSGLTQAIKTHNPKKARELMLQALESAKTDSEKALVYYSLFKLNIGEQAPDLTQAFEHLQQAIALDEVHYANYDPLTFKVTALLGVGGMGYALLATSGCTQLVLKCFWQNFQDKQLSEAVKIQQVQGQYVPALFGSGIYRYQGRLCLVTHYLPNAVDGARWLREHQRLSTEVGLVVALRLAEALQAIHQAGVLHLDLKPANVLLLPADVPKNWQVRVIDFGLSKLLPQFKSHEHTQTLTRTAAHTVVLFLDYASPEQKAGEKLTTASDVFSYGKTLFALVGDKESSEAPEVLEKWLRRCVKTHPEERIQLSELLQAWKESEPKSGQTLKHTVLEENSKGTPRTFSTLKAGKTENFTVYEKTFDVNGVPLEMVYIPEGEFMMGSENGLDDEKPVHKVKITQGFYMGKYPVTVGQFRRFVEATGYKTEAETGDGAYVWMGFKWKKDKKYNWKKPSFQQRDDEPVVCVSWNDAQEFVAWLGNAYRLPSEAEWEYACRGGTTTDYWWGDSMDDSRCWYINNSGSKTHPVEEKVNEHTNPFGLCDMNGNVWEWCEDSWEGNYKTPRTQAAYKIANENHLLRGGSWNYRSNNFRSAYRRYNSIKDYNCGFRLVFPTPRTIHP